MNYFITAIHTDSGKTLVSAIVCELLHADYWKPIQAGYPTDSETIRRLVSNSDTVIHPEAFKLSTPASPHAAAKVENLEIRATQLAIPYTDGRDLVVEGAGGCLVPLNDNEFVIDIASMLNCHVILVSNNYLGSINHTLLTFSELRHRKLPVAGIIFNGPANRETENIILHHTQLPCLLRIAPEKEISNETVKHNARKLNEGWGQRIK
ncbi:MAG TPA: dethiobiotin synthase [Sphingobacteriaceae bacterium]